MDIPRNLNPLTAPILLSNSIPWPSSQCFRWLLTWGLRIQQALFTQCIRSVCFFILTFIFQKAKSNFFFFQMPFNALKESQIQSFSFFPHNFSDPDVPPRKHSHPPSLRLPLLPRDSSFHRHCAPSFATSRTTNPSNLTIHELYQPSPKSPPPPTTTSPPSGRRTAKPLLCHGIQFPRFTGASQTCLQAQSVQ